MSVFLLFNLNNPMLWILIVAVIFLLFGGSKLPQLAKALGQTECSSLPRPDKLFAVAREPRVLLSILRVFSPPSL